MKNRLTKELSDLGLGEVERIADALAKHWDMVLTWNARTSLTTIVDPEEAAWRQYRDSLEALRLLPPGPLVDLGSGAGFPGIPLAVADPDRHVTLVECRRRKASFLSTVIARLGLRNACVLQQRAEEKPDGEYSVAVTRATFSSVEEILKMRQWLKPGGVLIAFRSGREALPEGANRHVYNLRGFPLVLDAWTSGPT